MDILFTICGRAGSKGIKNKNIRDFVGKPLPYYTLSCIELWKKRTSLDVEIDACINSDSEELLELVGGNPFISVMKLMRDESLSGDTIGKIDVIHDCVNRMEELTGKTYDIIVDLDITSPLRSVRNLEDLIRTHIDLNPDLTTSVAPARRNPYFNQLVKTEHGYKKPIDSNYTARQQAPEIYDMNASMYAYSPEHLKSGRLILDGYVECIEMYDTGILDLDHENDFVMMEIIAERLFSMMPEFGEIYNNIP